ncbi:L-serine ammonia-lyase [Paracoccaceae bacterium GXU_MW_L88]
MLSIFEIFKIGVGPSSSHTMGPMVAAARFLDLLQGERAPGAGQPASLKAILHGSLAFTGKGHATDRATILGLAGFDPESYDREKADKELARIAADKTIPVEGFGDLAFDPETDVVFDYETALPGHANGMVLEAYDAAGKLAAREVYYSVGGGFVLTEKELEADHGNEKPGDVPYPFTTMDQLLDLTRAKNLSIAEIARRNEAATMSHPEIDKGIAKIHGAMEDCVERGLTSDGILPGGLNVKRRAKAIHDALQAERGSNLAAPHVVNDWIATYAMAVNEENAAGGQVVTSPTNGAAGVLPAVLHYYLGHMPGASRSKIPEFLLTASAIGGLIKRNASISGAECGCQAEVGSASAMAAAGLCAVMGGTPEQVENAAEIALEHHLGMTCDPVKGLVQVPCIERNGLGAIKAVSAASLALRGTGEHLVSLDVCIETMRQTGRDMSDKYRETSRGGLAVNVPNC